MGHPALVAMPRCVVVRVPKVEIVEPAADAAAGAAAPSFRDEKTEQVARGGHAVCLGDAQTVAELSSYIEGGPHICRFTTSMGWMAGRRSFSLFNWTPFLRISHRLARVGKLGI